jgi:drug/metabolite transporter (DMT)-like permease
VLWAVPAAVDFAIQGGVSWPGVGFMAGSGALHVGYYVSLQRSYATGDLSVVYPLARGTGPVLSVTGAIVFLGERPSGVALAGGALIVLAIFSLVAGSTRGIGPALLTGLFIAVYTVWDAHAVNALHQPPIVYFWGAELIRATLLAPFAREVRATWDANRRAILGVGIFSPLAYVLVLFALTIAPITLVAPVRESSVVIGALLGAGVLGEGSLGRRVVAAVAIALGIVALAVG